MIYVGKASSLRQRLSNYFQDPRNMHPRTAQMVATAESVEWIEVRNEVEALMLEYSLIKQHRPRFNIRLRDDKSYPFLAVTLDEEWPAGDGDAGPQAQGRALLRAVRATPTPSARRSTCCCAAFPIRTCSRRQVQRAPAARPAVPAVPHREVQRARASARSTSRAYDELVDELCDFLDGDTDEIVKRLDAEMHAAVERLEFEQAARLPRPADRGAARRSRSNRWSPTATRTST